ncbi:MAG: transposase [Luteolibacter sp.]
MADSKRCRFKKIVAHGAETAVNPREKAPSLLRRTLGFLRLLLVIPETHAIESLNSSLRKISRHRNLFPTIDSLTKLFYLALRNLSAKWTVAVPNWPAALSYLTIEFSDRIPPNH